MFKKRNRRGLFLSKPPADGLGLLFLSPPTCPPCLACRPQTRQGECLLWGQTCSVCFHWGPPVAETTKGQWWGIKGPRGAAPSSASSHHPTLSSFFSPHRDRRLNPLRTCSDWWHHPSAEQPIFCLSVLLTWFLRVVNRNGLIVSNGFQARRGRLMSLLAGPNSSASRWNLKAANCTKVDQERRLTTNGLTQPSFTLARIWQHLHPPLQLLRVGEDLWINNLAD